MKKIKNYVDFKNINENVFTDIWSNIVSIINNFKDKYGKHAWINYNNYIKEEGKLPKGVEIFSPSVKDSKFNEARVNLEHSDIEIFNASANDLMEEIEESYKIRLETGKLTSMFVWGAPGIGKTDIVKQIAKKLDIELIVFHLSQIDPTDFRGLPIIIDINVKDEKIKRSGSALPLVFPTSNGNNEKGGILFLDEMNLAPDIVLKAAMPLALDGTYEGYELPNKWIIISAGNRKNDVPDTDLTEIKGALGNRFLHLNYTPTVQDWTQWAKTKEYIDPSLIAFLNFKPDWFHKLEGDDEQSSAWPSPRTWAEASYISWFRSNKSFNLDLTKKKRIYQMAVGFAAMTSFMQFEELSKLFSIDDIIEIYSKGKIKKDMPKRPDQVMAIINTIAYYKIGQKLTSKELDNLFNYAESLETFEYTTSLMSALKSAHSDKNGICYYHNEPELKKIFDKHVESWFDLYTDMKDDKTKLDI